jgi:hypothetical protein
MNSTAFARPSKPRVYRLWMTGESGLAYVKARYFMLTGGFKLAGAACTPPGYWEAKLCVFKEIVVPWYCIGPNTLPIDAPAG